MNSRLAGIDYGTVRIGIAVTDREHRIASPFDNYTRRERKPMPIIFAAWPKTRPSRNSSSGSPCI